MRKHILKLHKVKIVKLTHVSKVLGGSENTAASNIPDAICPSHTNDTTNENNTVPTFIITVCVTVSVNC